MLISTNDKQPQRARIDFNAARLHEVLAAVIDLSDPLRTNVQFTLQHEVMYADMTSVLTIAEAKTDKSGVAQTIVDAREALLTVSKKPSPLVKDLGEGVYLIHLLQGLTTGTAKRHTPGLTLAN